MTLAQQIITIELCVLGTMTTRFLPFLVFRENRETPKFIQYVGNFLPSAVFGMLVSIATFLLKGLCIKISHKFTFRCFHF